MLNYTFNLLKTVYKIHKSTLKHFVQLQINHDYVWTEKNATYTVYKQKGLYLLYVRYKTGDPSEFLGFKLDVSESNHRDNMGKVGSAPGHQTLRDPEGTRFYIWFVVI